jgi:putative ABC transport system permease protein
MLIGENIRMAFTSLLANKTRALLTMLGIIIGIASVITIMTVGNSLTASVSSEMESIGAGNVSVYLTRKQTEQEKRENGITFGKLTSSRSVRSSDLISDEMIRRLIDDFGDRIKAVSIEKDMGSTTIKAGTNSATMNLSGVSAGYFTANSTKLLAGTLITKEQLADKRNAIVMADTVCDKLWGLAPADAVGKTFSAQIDDQTLEFTIVGVYEYQQAAAVSLISFGDTATSAYIPLTTAQSLRHSKGYANFDVVAGEGEESSSFIRDLKTYMNGYYRTNTMFEVDAFSLASLAESMTTLMNSVTLAISIIAGIALLVGGIGVMNIMLVSITERTREIGTRKALGATNSSIRIQFITESMIICLIGGAIGVALGIGMGAIAAKLMGYPAKASIGSIIGSLLFSLAIGVFFGYYPANKAAKMNPIEALRYE